jgi:Tol biopolymer transport system component
MRPDGSALTQLTASDSPDSRALYPHWTPDGRILFNQQSPGVLEVWTMNADGTDARVLLPSTRDATEHQLRFDPDWQPRASQ